MRETIQPNTVSVAAVQSPLSVTATDGASGSSGEECILTVSAPSVEEERHVMWDVPQLPTACSDLRAFTSESFAVRHGETSLVKFSATLQPRLVIISRVSSPITLVTDPAS